MSTSGASRPDRRWIAAALTVLAVAAALRLTRLGEVPPGIHLDGANNAWNAKCLLETGRDATGTSWPILYTKGFGEYGTTPYIYAAMPFIALGGMNRVTAILPSAIGGIATVLLIFWIGVRLFDRGTALAAATILALAPWHLFLSRTAHEAGIVPLLVAAPVAAAVWAGLLPGGGSPRLVRAAITGALAGAACYGYGAVRLFLPALAALALVIDRLRWAAILRTSNGRAALAAFVVAVMLVAGPLAWAHATGDQIGRRALSVPIWLPEDGIAARAVKVVTRYAIHFGADFLFVSGDPWRPNSIPGVAPLRPWMAPMLVGGIAVAAIAARRRKKSGATAEAADGIAASRFLVAMLLAYPAGDIVTGHAGVHALRSAPGLVGLVLATGLGASRAAGWLVARYGRRGWMTIAVALVAIAAFDSRVVKWYFSEMPRTEDAYHVYSADLLAACAWLRPRVDQADAVFLTTNTPGISANTWAIIAFGLDHDPKRWFSEELRFVDLPPFRSCVRFGKVHLMLPDEWKDALRVLLENGRSDRVLFVLRPSEPAPGEPAGTIRGPSGELELVLYDVAL